MRVAAEEQGTAPVRPPPAQEDADGGGLAGPVGPQKGHDLSRIDIQVDAFQGFGSAEGFVDPLQPGHQVCVGIHRYFAVIALPFLAL